MPTIKPKQADIKEILQSFGGIGSAGTARAHTCQEMQNFRLLPDGTLEKRCGFKKKYALEGAIRGFWDGYIDGAPITCVVAGMNVYIQESGTFVKKRTLESTSGVVHFVYYCDHLYLLDGKQIYVYMTQSANFQPATGYVPLIGFNWSPTSMGDLHEPVNLFSNRMRVHYANLEGGKVYQLPFSAVSIDRMFADGATVTDYTFTAGSSSFTVNQIYSSLTVSFTTTVNDQDIAYINQSRQALSERLDEREQLFLFGARSGNYLFGSKPVDDLMLASSRGTYPLSDPLYFPMNMKLAAGTSTNPITSVYKQHDRFLAFHGNGAFSLQIDKNDRLLAYPLLFGYGCTAKLPYLAIDDRLIIINHGGIFMISSDSSDPDQFDLVPIAESIPALKNVSFAQNADVCYDAAHGELWFYDKLRPEKIYVYHLQKKVWYTFSGFTPAFFVTYQGNVGFACETSIYLFDESRNTDDGEPIVASLTSGYLFADSAETLKRVSRITLLTSCGENTVQLVLHTDKREIPLHVAAKPEQELPVLYDFRVEQGRTRLIRLSLTDSGDYRSRIYRLAVFANS